MIVLPLDALRTRILRFIAESPSKVCFGHLKRHINKTHQADVKALKSVVAGLIQEGTLCYTYHFGRSFIDLSYDGPRIVSDHVVIKPPRCFWSASPDQRVVSIARGASFGGGDHPSTRLAIQLIDAALHLPAFREKMPALKAIDIGTGSGILALVAAKLGVGNICGVDIDPCAIFEARENLRMNHVGNRVVLLEGILDEIDGVYDMVFANLRAPTLTALRDQLERVVATDSLLVFSGLKSNELNPIANHYKKAGYFLFNERTETDWGALCLVRGALASETTPSI